MTAGDRHSSNTNDRGSAEQRRKRKNWILEIWGADVDVVTLQQLTELDEAFRDDGMPLWDIGVGPRSVHANEWWWTIEKGLGIPACRCFRCGKLVTYETMEVDRIKPGAEGGRYVKSNVRPVCCDCNKKLEGEARKRRNAKRKKRNEQARARRKRRADDRLATELMMA